jgi:DNA repair exonuclease SbcCD nuclease subunit
MSKALIFSDLHIHSHKDRVDRLEDCIKVLDWVFEQAFENNCRYIFFLGDLFHERSKIDVRNYLKTFDVFKKHLIDKKNNLKVYLLVGNHDMYHRERWDINSVKPLGAIPQVTVVEYPQQTLIEDVKIDWMPYTENPINDLKELKEKNSGPGDVLFGHMSVHGALLNLCYETKSDVFVEHDNDMIPVDASVFSDWEMVFLGHYHGPQNINEKIEYVGSPLELSFGESFQEKHIIILDLKTLKKKYVKNNFSPKHLIVTPKDLKDENYNLEGNFIRLVSNGLSSREIIDIKKETEDNNKILSFDIKQNKTKTQEDSNNIENAKSILINTEGMLENYIKKKGVPKDLDLEKLLSIGKKCLSSEVDGEIS